MLAEVHDDPIPEIRDHDLQDVVQNPVIPTEMPHQFDSESLNIELGTYYLSASE